MNKWLKIFIIVGSVLIVGVIGYFIHKSYVNFIGDDVEPFTAEYREYAYVDDFIFMNANLNEIENNYYKLIELEDRDTTMIKEIDNDKPLERKKVIPPKDHPWRKKFSRRI